ncbi:hypothetical protein ACFQ7F_26630 [Streptomyces sp. NPDC056486]|uniref:hypothetical protein n=1 Tax=Streptomyces sp. NPDC056486 TaxID=3345835 RepID=UPI003688DA3F
MASFDTGRLRAIVKILDQASTHLRLAARECALTGSATAMTRSAAEPAASGIATSGATAPGTTASGITASGITALLSVSEQASGSVRRALVHIRNGEVQDAEDELDRARTQPCGPDLTPAGLPRPLPQRVTTALCLMQGITGFFPSETEQVLMRAALPAGAGTLRVGSALPIAAAPCSPSRSLTRMG